MLRCPQTSTLFPYTTLFRSFTCVNVGPNPVTLTVTDVNGNEQTCTATVTVEDRSEPVTVEPQTTTQLAASRNANITPAQINNCSADACGIAPISVTPTTFTA